MLLLLRKRFRNLSVSRKMVRGISYTITDVAKKAGVSIATVSRILNNQPGYSKKTKERVLQVIQELGYEPNAVARGLINKKTESIGVLFPSISSFLFFEIPRWN